MVRAMARRHSRDAATLEELAQAGFLGLLGATDRYDPARDNGGRFATVAGCWIRPALSGVPRRRPAAEVPSGLLEWLPDDDEPDEAPTTADVGANPAAATPRQRQVLKFFNGPRC